MPPDYTTLSLAAKCVLLSAEPFMIGQRVSKTKMEMNPDARKELVGQRLVCVYWHIVGGGWTYVVTQYGEEAIRQLHCDTKPLDRNIEQMRMFD